MKDPIKHVQVKISADLADWFDANCPTFSKQDFVEQCFILLRLAVEKGDLPHPNSFAALSAVRAYGALTQTETRG